MDRVSFFKREDSQGITWSPDIDRLLRKWRRQIHLRRDRCAVVASRYRIAYYGIYLLATLIMGITSAANITIFGLTDQDTCITAPWWNLFIGIMGVVAALCTAIIGTFNFSSLSERYREASSKYSGIARAIDTTLATPIVFRGNPIDILDSIRSTYDKVVETSPDIIQDDEDELHHTIQAIPPPAPMLGSVEDSNDIGSLENVLKDKFDLDDEIYKAHSISIREDD